jgi:O-antigen/teichoic acid export membrane protein
MNKKTHQNNANNLIAKNTFVLYARMILTMGISLYSSRIVLSSLGVVDYGIYNVIGGLVAVFSFMSYTLSSGTQRFLNIAIGENDQTSIKEVFSASLVINLIFGILILILSETIGNWFFIHEFNIPASRYIASAIVFQLTIITCIVTILQIPFNAIIISHEQMKFFAFISIIESILKLGAALMLNTFAIDNLILYSALILTINITTLTVYFIIVRKRFIDNIFYLSKVKSVYKSMLGFSGWNIFGSMSSVLSNQGVNILLNIFFGPIVNSSRGVSFQVNGALNNFANGFQTAVNPRIMKLYAQNKLDEMMDLVTKNSKFSFYLIYIICFPIILEIDWILKLWLVEVPKYTVIFCKIIIIQSIFLSYHRPLATVIHAIGKMKIPNLTSGIIYLMVLPISYLFLDAGYAPYLPFIISALSFPIAMIVDLIILKYFIKFKVRIFLKDAVIKPYLILIAISFLLIIIRKIVIKTSTFGSTINSVFIIFISIVISSVMIFIIGLDKKMKNKLISYISNWFKEK